jgi:ABC-type lipoprotein export system ATPase subunit
MIATNNVQYKYPESQQLSFPEIFIKEKEQWLLKGSSGSGKTTFIHLLAGILTPTRGSVSINSVLLENLNQSGLDRFRTKNVGLIFQKHLFIHSISMYQNVLIPRKYGGGNSDKNQIYQLMDDLDIAHLAGNKPIHLSQGELQRFSIARALANKPKVVIADEPTSSLDDVNCRRFIELVQKNCEQHGATLLIATHDARVEKHFKHIIRLN